MAKLTSKEDIKQLLLEAYDPEYYAQLYRQMCYAFGEKWRGRVTGVTDEGDFPIFPDIVVRFLEIGQSRKIFTSQYIGLSKIMYMTPKPEFPQLDKFTAETVAQFYLKRANSPYGKWGDELDFAFMEGDGLGIGWVQIGAKTNPNTGYQYVSLRHSPTVQTLWSRHARNPGSTDWICFVHHYPKHEAFRLFGEKNCKDHVRDMWDNFGSHKLEIVRIFEYYDIGITGAPTRAIIPGMMTNPPIRYEKNPYPCIPAAHMLHVVAPGMRRPIGRIALQMQDQEALNDVERYLRKVLKSPSFDIVDVTMLDTDDLRRVSAGDQNVKVKMTSNKANAVPYYRIPSAEAANTILALKEMYETNISQSSGTTDFDRGTQPSKTRTLGENMMVREDGQVQSGRTERQAAELHRSTCEKVLKIANVIDRDPLMLDIFGYNVPINEPSEPMSYIQNFLAEESEVIVDEAAIQKKDLMRERAQRLQELQVLTPFVGPGMVSPQWFIEEHIKAIGEDPKVVIDQSAVGGAMQQGMMQQPVGTPTEGVPQ